MTEGRIEVAGIQEMRRQLVKLKNRAPSALSNAINRTTTNIKKNMAQQAAARYYITSTRVKDTVNERKANRNDLKGMVVSKGTPISLAKFKVSPNRPVQYSRGRPSPRMYKAAVKKGHGTDPLDGNPKSFIAVMKNGHRGVFTRTGKWETEHEASKTRTREFKRKAREKAHTGHNEIIQEKYGPSVPQMIRNEESMAFIRKDARSTMEKRLDAEIANILRKG